MDRRTVLKGLAGAGSLAVSGGLSMPALSQGAAAKTLRFVPQADLANFDPIWTTQYVVRNAAVLVWDTLYGVDDKLQPQRQMVESEEVSSDGLTWTFRLRPGLKFHDGEPVRAKDVVASLTRWSNRDSMGLMLKAIQNELTAVDDRTFKWVLKKPYPKMLLALGKNNTPCAFIMPERIAQTDPFKQISEYVGSGPMKFVRNEWVPGARSVFEKFADYVPRQEKNSWFAGGKQMLLDRIEWVVIPDPATAAAALQNGEVDWWENPLPDLVPVLKKNRNINVDIADPLGNVGSFRMNHHASAVRQCEGAARRAYRAEPGRLYARAGRRRHLAMEAAARFLYAQYAALYRRGRRNPQAAQYRCGQETSGRERLCQRAGLLHRRAGSGDHQGARRCHRRSVEAHRHECRFRRDRLGDGRRSPCPESAAQPGRLGDVPHLARRCGLHESRRVYRHSGQRRQGVVWLAEQPRRGKEVTAWFEAKNLDEEKAAVARLNKAALEDVVYAPTGFFLSYTAWRKNVSGIVKGPVPFSWGVSKTA